MTNSPLSFKRLPFIVLIGLCGAIFCLNSAQARETEYDPSFGATRPLEPNSLFLDYNQNYYLKTLLQGTSSVETFLSRMPKMLRSSYTLVYETGSIQEATLQDPRVIVFSPTANLVLSFNGHKDMIGGNSIEAVEYDDIANKFSFHEVTYTADGKFHDHVNPQKCQACHTDAYIPNWRPYEDWRGAFGGKRDDFDAVTVNAMDSGLAIAVQNTKKAKSILANFLDFQDKRESNGDRYRQLYNPLGNKRFPFLSDDLLGKTFPAMDIEPNRRLTLGLVFRLSRMLGAKIQQTQLFKDYPASVTAQLLDCQPWNSPLVQRLENLENSSPLVNIARFNTPIPKALKRAMGSEIYASSYRFLNALSVTGISPEYWSINIGVRAPKLSVVNFFAGENAGLTSFTGFYEMSEAPLLAGQYLYGVLQSRNPLLAVNSPESFMTVAKGGIVPADMLSALGKLIPIYSWDVVQNQICAKLAPMVQAENNQNKPVSLELNPEQRERYGRWAAGRPYALDRCTVCHAERAFQAAPYIPFDKPEMLRVRLRENGGALLKEIIKRTDYLAPDEIRMPRGAFSLPLDQRRDLINYFKNI